MKPTEDLQGAEAIAKFREIVGHNAICMFHTRHGKKVDVTPMTVQQVDDEGCLWFMSGRSSDRNAHITMDPIVLFTIAETGRSEYLVVHGRTSIVDDLAKKRELFSTLAKAWFPDGAEDRELTLLKVEPIEARYWDTTDGRIAQMLKITGAAITGNMNSSGSVQGRLTVEKPTNVATDSVPHDSGKNTGK